MAVSLALPTHDYYRHVATNMTRKTDGKCYHCHKRIKKNDPIVSRRAWSTKYYHKSCAERLNII